jgi:uncharacterized protein YjdB
VKSGIRNLYPNIYIKAFNDYANSLKAGDSVTFSGTQDLKLTIPNSVTVIGSADRPAINGLFTFYRLFKGDDDMNPTNATIYGYKGSFAESFAEQSRLPFEALPAVSSTDIKISGSKNTIGVGEQLKLKHTITPSDTTDAIVWKSSANEVATVDGNGKITGTGVGSAVIRATTTSGKHMDFIITVGEAPTSVTVKNSTASIGVGETYIQKGTINDTAVTKTLTYTSSDTFVAAVDSKGKVTAKEVGTAEITISSYNGKTASYTVNVLKAPTSIKLTATQSGIKVGKKLTLKTTLSTGSASYHLTYTSSNKAIATVSPAGVVTAKKAGKVTITVTTYNGKKATYKISVTK